MGLRVVVVHYRSVNAARKQAIEGAVQRAVEQAEQEQAACQSERNEG
jgi:hypothetical protein